MKPWLRNIIAVVFGFGCGFLVVSLAERLLIVMDVRSSLPIAKAVGAVAALSKKILLALAFGAVLMVAELAQDTNFPASAACAGRVVSAGLAPPRQVRAPARTGQRNRRLHEPRLAGPPGQQVLELDRGMGLGGADACAPWRCGAQRH